MEIKNIYHVSLQNREESNVKSDFQKCKIQFQLQMSLRASGTGIFNFCVCFREHFPIYFPISVWL